MSTKLKGAALKAASDPSQSPSTKAAPKRGRQPARSRNAKATKASGPFRRNRDLDDYEPRTTFHLRRQLRQEGQQGRLRSLLAGDRDARRLANAKAIHMAEDAGVDVENDHAFLKWLIQNLPALIEAIMKIFSHGGVPV